MKNQIKKILIMIIGIIVVSLFLGCASGPKFGTPSTLQATLNAVSEQFPIEIAGKKVKLSFEGDFWRGQVDGKDTLAGDCKIEENANGAIITLNQSWAYIDTGKKDPIKGGSIAKWQKTPGPEIKLEYTAGPPAKFSKK